jgi:carbamoyl-phosphate synthase large subunit
MNVLLTCAGRRNYLVKFFGDALGAQGQVFAADASTEAPALQEADRAFVVPSINHPSYIDSLLSICRKYEAHLLFSLNDLELPLIAREKERFLQIGTVPVVSSPEVIDICFDKWATLGFLRDCGLDVASTCDSLDDAQEFLSQGELTFPLVIKPRWGSASIGIEYPEDKEELDLAYRLVRKRLPRTILAGPSAEDLAHSILIQEFLTGEEYGLDIINDLDGNYVTTFVKRKLKMRAGETDRSVTVQDNRLMEVGRTIGQQLGHIGNLDCDVFVTDSGCYVLEMNPRFGGGYPFSHIAGANLPAAIIAWARGETPDPSWLTVEYDVTASKYYDLIIVDESQIQKPEEDCVKR